MRFLVCLLLLSVLCPSRLLAQDSLSTRYKTSVDFNQTLTPYKDIDTSLQRDEIFHPLIKTMSFIQDQGNIGSPAASLLGEGVLSHFPGFQLGTSAMEMYYKKAADTRYFKNKKPYTDIQYVQGAKELLFMNLLHAQQIQARWNMGVDFRRISSQGFYTNQRSSIWSTRLFSSYQSKNQRYVLLNNLIWNKGFVEQNGGIESDSAFEAITTASKQVSVNLEGSGTDGSGGPRNYFRNTSFQSKQFWYLGKYQTLINGNDTSRKFESRAHLSHTLDVSRFSFLYRDKQLLNKDYYPTFYFDTTQTYDSLHYLTVSNSIGYSSLSSQAKRVSFSALLNHQYIEIAQRTNNRIFNNVSATGVLQLGLPLKPTFYGCYFLQGYNQGDYQLKGNFTLPFKAVSAQLDLTQEAYEQDYLVNNFISNHYLWNNNFAKTERTKIGVTLATKHKHPLALDIQYSSTSQLVYFDTLGLPRQITKAITLLQAEVKKSFELGNWHLDNKILAQQTNGKDYLRLPEVAVFERLYYQRRLFKKVLLVQAGVDLSWYTAFYARVFNPVTRQFQLQNEAKIGNYPVVDLFFNMHIKRAVLFFKSENINADLSGKNYYSSPHQPMPYRAFRFGIRWRMYD